MAFASISMGQYVPTDSLLHSLDPRAKLLLLVMIMAAVFPSDDLLSLLCCAAGLWGALKLSNLSLRLILRSCRPALFLAFFSFAFNLAAGLWELRGSGEIFDLLPAVVTGLVAASRLLFLVSFAVLLPLTTTPLELTDGMDSLCSPFKRLGLPVHEFTMMIGIALRFIPLLMDETDRIVKAQLSRGARLDQGHGVRRMIAFFPVVIPLFVMIFRRAEELALAMEARGYRGGEGRTRRRPLVWKKRDTGATIFVIFLVVIFTLFRVHVARRAFGQ